MLVSLSEGQSELDFTSPFIDDFEMMRLNFENLVKAQKAEKSDGIDALEHQSQPSSCPISLTIGNDWCFSQSVDGSMMIDIIKTFQIP